jgi:Flp pilus assembly protein TadD
MRKRSNPARPANALAKAVGHLARGAWQRAHELVQQEESPYAAWLHGIAHTLEGDLENARYWYRRAGRSFAGKDAVQEEIAAARRALREGPPRGKT